MKRLIKYPGKRFLMVIPAIMLSLFLQAQDTITLDFCYQQVQKTYPLARQSGLLDNSSLLRLKNLNKNYLPSINVNGSASWQNEVTMVSISLPAGLPPVQGPSIPKDQYKLTLDVSESIYDGNVTSYQKKLEKFNLNVDQKNVDASLYLVKDQVNQFYFNILLTQKNVKLLQESKNQLESKWNEVESAVRNGAMLKMNADLIRAEIIKLEQNIYELSMDRLASIRMLSELISLPMDELSAFKTPVITVPGLSYENKRIEFELYSIQRDRVSLMKNMVTTKWNPKISAYGQLGYGRPGLNMLSNSFDPWWLFGARLTWNFFNWNLNKNEKRIFDIQGEIVESQKETFEKNLRITSENDLAQITKLNELLQKDQEIIDLRARITKSASFQLDNGVITSSDYISRMNEERQARLGMKLHLVRLELAKLTYLYDLGKL